jgi:hypothetical protein
MWLLWHFQVASRPQVNGTLVPASSQDRVFLSSTTTRPPPLQHLTPELVSWPRPARPSVILETGMFSLSSNYFAALNFSYLFPGSISPPSPTLHHLLNFLIAPLHQPMPQRFAHNHNWVHQPLPPHPTMTPFTTTLPSMTNYSIPHFIRTGGHSISLWSTRHVS